MGLAIVYEPSSFSFSDRIMGRQSSGIGFLRAVAATQPEKLWCYCGSRDGAVAFARDVYTAGARQTTMAWVPWHHPENLAEPGLLYRPDPVLGLEAWRRYTRADSTAYSLCGITHTMATHAVMEAITALIHAPVEPWDALICTSTVARETAVRLIESAADYAAERLGATRFTLPQLPVIPLGIHASDFAPEAIGPQAGARVALGIAPDAFVVLFVGRLSFHAKAHPVPLYLALEQLARGRPVTLLQAGLFENTHVEQAFAIDAQALCPNVTMRTANGKDAVAMKQAWAAADVFTSLSDNVQETFGLTPPEAMAAGLPVVVSDWDGYRDTVRDGIDGFRVPIVMPGPGHGNGFGPRYDDGVTTYDYYCGHLCQFAAVDVPATTAAFKRLADDAELRARMGAAGRERVRTTFDWAVVMRQYQALWDELGERRRAAPPRDAAGPHLRPERPDPFTLFASHPTAAVTSQTLFRLGSNGGLSDPVAYKRLRTVDYAAPVLPDDDTIHRVVVALTADPGSDAAPWRTFGWLAASCYGPGPIDARSQRQLVEALTWLSKMGVLDFRA